MYCNIIRHLGKNVCAQYRCLALIGRSPPNRAAKSRVPTGNGLLATRLALTSSQRRLTPRHRRRDTVGQWLVAAQLQPLSQKSSVDVLAAWQPAQPLMRAAQAL